MAGLPWLIVLAVLAYVSLRRGWTWALIVFVFCMGVVGGGTSGGQAIYEGTTGLLAGIWGGVVGLANSAAG